jgi:hypothetical protein
VGPLGSVTCPEVSTGGKRVYTRNRREAKKTYSGLEVMVPISDGQIGYVGCSSNSGR